jgi:hypothetical protein
MLFDSAKVFEQQAIVFERACSFEQHSATKVRTNAFEQCAPAKTFLKKFHARLTIYLTRISLCGILTWFGTASDHLQDQTNNSHNSPEPRRSWERQLFSIPRVWRHESPDWRGFWYRHRQRIPAKNRAKRGLLSYKRRGALTPAE